MVLLWRIRRLLRPASSPRKTSTLMRRLSARPALRRQPITGLDFQDLVMPAHWSARTRHAPNAMVSSIPAKSSWTNLSLKLDGAGLA